MANAYGWGVTGAMRGCGRVTYKSFGDRFEDRDDGTDGEGKVACGVEASLLFKTRISWYRNRDLAM